jgi:hypothetical protein
MRPYDDDDLDNEPIEPEDDHGSRKTGRWL